MQIFWDNHELAAAGISNAVVTIGNFDGCHVGHQEIFRRTIGYASEIGGISVVYTFNPHPASVLKGITPQLLFTVEEKVAAIESLGLDVLVVVPFTRDFADTKPDLFVKRIIIDLLQAKGIVVGHDFTFGRKAKGDIPFLKQKGEEHGFFVDCVDPVSVGDVVVSSSCLRKMIQSGDVAAVNELMIHPYRLQGSVIHGMSRGKTLGFPTANIQPNKALLPAYGVYAVRIYFKDQILGGVANIGNNPTFGDTGTSLETFIFDFQDDLYGSEITIEFFQHLRGEIKFSDKHYLVEQIELDCAQAREVLKTLGKA